MAWSRHRFRDCRDIPDKAIKPAVHRSRFDCDQLKLWRIPCKRRGTGLAALGCARYLCRDPNWQLDGVDANFNSVIQPVRQRKLSCSVGAENRSLTGGNIRFSHRVVFGCFGRAWLRAFGVASLLGTAAF